MKNKGMLIQNLDKIKLETKLLYERAQLNKLDRKQLFTGISYRNPLSNFQLKSIIENKIKQIHISELDKGTIKFKLTQHNIDVQAIEDILKSQKIKQQLINKEVKSVCNYYVINNIDTHNITDYCNKFLEFSLHSDVNFHFIPNQKSLNLEVAITNQAIRRMRQPKNQSRIFQESCQLKKQNSEWSVEQSKISHIYVDLFNQSYKPKIISSNPEIYVQLVKSKKLPSSIPTKIQFWEIVFNQFQSLLQLQPSEINHFEAQKLIKERTIQYLQSKFNYQLPYQYNDVIDYIDRLWSAQGPKEVEDRMPYWAIIYVYMRAGRIDLITILIEQYQGQLPLKKFLRDLQTYLSVVNNPKQFADFRNRLNNEQVKKKVVDIFKQQIYHLLCHNSYVMTEKFTENDYERFWHFLRGCSIEQNNPETLSFKQLKDMVVAKSRQTHNFDINILLYVQAYEEVIQRLEKNNYELMVHFILVCKQIQLQKFRLISNIVSLQDILNKYLVQFFYRKPELGIPYLNYLDYESRVKLLTELIVNNSSAKDFFGIQNEKFEYFQISQIRSQLSDKCWKDLAYLVSLKLIQKNNYYQVPLKIIYQYCDESKVIQIILSYQIKLISKTTRQTGPEKRQLNQLLKRILDDYYIKGIFNNYRIYDVLQQFMLCTICLVDIQKNKNYQQIQIAKKYLPSNNQNRNDAIVIEWLRQKNSFHIYLEFLKLVLQALMQLKSRQKYKQFVEAIYYYIKEQSESTIPNEIQREKLIEINKLFQKNNYDLQ